MNQPYLLWMAASAVLCAVLHGFLAKNLRRPWALAGWTLLFGVLFGIVGAKIVYGIVQIQFLLTEGMLEHLFSADMSRFSYYGGLAGVCLGAILAARLTGNRPLPALDAFAPAGALMAAAARFCEYFLGTLCVGRYIDEDSFFCFFPAGVQNEWGEWYVAVYMLAGLCSLIVFFLSLLRLRERRFIRTLFYLCLPQIICESLRNQSLLVHEFVRIEQLFCMVALEVILILYGLRTPRNAKGRFLPAIIGLICAGVFVAAEFALDKTSIPHLATYAVMALGLAVLAWMECRAFRRIAAS